MILCCGEALIDMLPRRLPDGQEAFLPVPGGAVFNTAIALGRLGIETGFFGGLSQDRFGRQLRAALAAAGVDTGPSAPSPQPSTLAFVALENGQARYEFLDAGSAGRMLDLADLPPPSDRVRALFLGGISLVNDPAATAFETLALRPAADGARAPVVMLDPNIRRDFITDSAAYRARLARLIARADIVKLSDEDLDWLIGPEAPGSLADRARNLLAQGPGLVLITEGARGAHAFTRSHHVHVPAPSVEVVDTVGAGDSFNAGVLAALDRLGALGDPRTRQGGAAIPPDALDRAALTDCLTLGIAVATIVVGRAGADAPWPDALPAHARALLSRSMPDPDTQPREAP